MSNRPGYKHTPLGWIPEEWHIQSLGDLAIKVGSGITPTGGEKVYKKEGRFFLRSQNVGWGQLLLDDVAFIDESTHKTFSSTEIKENDVLLNITGASIGRSAVADKTVVGGNVNQHVCIIRVNGTLVPQYLNSYLISTKGQNLINSYQAGGNRQGLNFEQIKSFPVPVPTYTEQHKIASILSTWNEAIIKTQEVITQLQRRNRSFIQQLLTGKKRLTGFSKPWKEIHLAEAFDERNETGHIDLNLLSVGSIGVYPQSQSAKRDTSNSDKAKYKRICPDDIGYNTMRMWQGRSALSTLEGIVSPAYTIVIPKKRQHSEFFAYLFKLPSVVNKFLRHSQGLVEDTLNCKFKNFATVKVDVPEYEEQVAIANILTTAKSEMKFYEQKLIALHQQKKGLMQKLLTGDVRVNK